MKSKLNNKDIYALGGIILSSAVIMIAFIVIKGAVYGSQMDWVSQHYPIPEYFRTLFYDTHQLFPSYAANIGAGESIYSLSYYGLYSPVTLLSYLLPFVPMPYYMMMTSVLTVYASDCIFYFLIRKRHDLKVTVFMSVLFAFSFVLIFHSHRHIMFVSFMPFLLLALHFTDRYFETGRRWPLVLSAFLMIMCNYFFAVTALFALAAYGMAKTIDEKLSFGGFVKRYAPFVMLLFVSVLMSCMLLLPTAYGLLAGRDEGNVAVSLASFLPRMRFDWLTYNNYSMGLSAFGVFACIHGIFYAKGGRRFLCVLTILFAVCPLLVFILNGTLYFDSKVLIAFLPLALYAIVPFIEDVYENGISRLKLPLTVFVVLSAMCLVINFSDALVKVYAADAAVTAVVLLRLNKKFDKRLFCFFLAVAVGTCCFKNHFDELVLTGQFAEIENDTVTELIDDVSKGKVVRTAVDVRRVDTPNKVYSIDQYQDTVYSSIHSKDYNTFYFEKMCNENEYRNSALTTRSQNLFFNCFMGDRYIVSDRPLQNYGYELLKDTGDGHYLYENRNALPLAYHTSQLMSQREFDSLSYPATVEALTRYTIVDKDIPDTDFVSQMQRVDIGDIFDIGDELEDGDSCTNGSDGEHSFELKSRLAEYSKDLPESCKGKLLVIKFHVDNPKEKHDSGAAKLGDVTIIINDIKNKLTDPDWKYFNNNNDMEYVLSDCKDKLDITIKGGNFKISALEAYTADTSYFDKLSDNRAAFDFDVSQTKGDSITGTVNAPEDGYLTTSFVYLDGMTAEIDGEKVTPEKVNTAFVGLPVTKGSHKVVITYHAPWLSAGIAASGAGFAVFLLVIILDIFKKKKDK